MKELKPDEWRDELGAALEFRETYAREKIWSILEQCFFNDPKSEAAVGENLIFEQGDALLAGINVSQPNISVYAEGQESLETAPIVEQFANYLVRATKLNAQVEAASLSNYLYDRAILKLGYDSEFGYDPYYDIGTATEPESMTYTQFDKRGHRIEFSGATPGQFWVAPVLPHDFLVPWGTYSLDDAPWCAHRIIRTNSDIKADPKYSNKQNLQPQMSAQSFIESYLKGRKRIDRLSHIKRHGYSSSKNLIYNELWEIHDRRTGKIYVICFDHKKFLRNGRDFLQVSGELPFVSSTFVPHTRTFWNTPLAYYLMQHQRESHDVSFQAQKQRRSNNLKFLIDENAFDADEEERLLSDENALFARVTGSGGNIGNVVKAFPQIQSFDLMNEADYIRRNARSAIGFGRNQLGEFDSSSRRTATEAMNVSKGAEKREKRRYGAVEYLYLETIRKLVGIASVVWKRPRTIRVGPQEWKQVSAQLLRGRFHFDLQLTEKQVMTSMQRQISALTLFGQLAMIPGANLPVLWKYVTDASGDPSFGTFFNFGGQGQGVSMLPQGASTQSMASPPRKQVNSAGV